MTSLTFRKAERKQAKARIALAGPSGSGKTFTSLLIARGLAGKHGTIAFIDTENGSGELYSHITDYDILRITAPFTPEKYTEAIRAAEEAGYDAIIIDSLTHAWAGEGGCLDIQGKIADSGKGNSYTAWRSVTPKHNALVEAMLQSKCHIIATMRSKTEYIQQSGNNGKTEIKKVGLAPVQRDGIEYEFTVVFDLSIDHNAMVSKDRTSVFDGRIFKPTEATGAEVRTWLMSGATEIASQPLPATDLVAPTSGKGQKQPEPPSMSADKDIPPDSQDEIYREERERFVAEYEIIAHEINEHGTSLERLRAEYERQRANIENLPDDLRKRVNLHVNTLKAQLTKKTTPAGRK